jgi:hypothetical protein
MWTSSQRFLFPSEWFQPFLSLHFASGTSREGAALANRGTGVHEHSQSQVMVLSAAFTPRPARSVKSASTR